MKAEKVNQFNQYGCRFAGDLVVIDYQQEWKSNPKHGLFGSGSIFDALDEAKQYAKQNFVDFNILLSIPVLVIELPK